MAVFAISAADLICGRNHRCPHRSCSSLQYGLQLKVLLSYEIEHQLNAALVHVATQFGLYATWMHRCCTHATASVPFVKRNREESVCGLRPAICDEGFIGRLFKVGIFQVNIGKAVT